MKDRKRDPSFKSISGFIPAELSAKIKQKMKERGLTQSELLEEACHMWLTGDLPKPKNIHELVARNLSLLKDIGVDQKTLVAIAEGKALPTRVDFCAILTAMELPKEERERLWRQAYGSDMQKECSDERHSTGNK